MKTNSKIHYALHNIKQNKTRTALTIIIFYVLSVLAIFGFYTSISYSSSIKDSLLKGFEEEKGVSITIISNSSISSIQLEESLSIINKYQDNIEYVYHNETELYLYDFENITRTDFEIEENYNINKLTSNSASILLPMSLKENYNIGEFYEYKEIDLEIIGFFSSENLDSYPIIDITYFSNNWDLNRFFVKSSNIISQSNIDKINQLYEELNSLKHFTVSSYGINYYYENLNQSKILTYVMILCSIILMIVFSSTILNVILISLEENSYFIGMLRAIGCSNKKVFEIIFFEMIFILLFSTILSTVTILLLIPLVSQEMIMMINTILGEDKIIIYNLEFQWFLPLLWFLFSCIFMTLVFKKTIKKLLDDNPISILKEGSYR